MKAPIIPLTAMLWAGCMLISTATANAQAKAGVKARKYYIWSFGAGTFLPFGKTSGIDAQFPYAVIPTAGGPPTTQIFTGTVNRSFSTGVFYLLNFTNLEIVLKRHSYNWGLGMFVEHGVLGFSWVEGYSRIFPVGKFLLKTGLDLNLVSSGRKLIGNIDNSGVEVDVFNMKAQPQYQICPDDGPPVTYNATRLKVEYGYTAVFFQPKLVLATPPIRKWVFSLESGYMLPTVPSAELEFVQVDSGGNNPHEAGRHPIGQYGFFSGLHIAVNAGIAW